MNRTSGGRPALRIDVQAEDVGRALGQVVVVVLELLRELLERQAVRRVDGGRLTDDQIEQLGQALLAVRDQLRSLQESFGVTDEQRHRTLEFAHRLVGDNFGTQRTERDQT